MGTRIPLSLRIAVALLPRDARDEVLGDLLEQWADVRRGPLGGRTLWAWRQPLAALRARLAFGGAPEEAAGRRRSADGRGAGGFDRGGSSAVSMLDVKLGVRMLVKHPGLTLAGGAGIAVGVAVAIGFFTFMKAMFFPTIPLDEGHRLVGLENWDLEINNEERRSLHDFGVWREEVRSVQDMTAYRTVSRNLFLDGGAAELVEVAEITPSGFRLARVPPLMGRTLVDGDQAAEAPPVVVIGYQVWRSRFGGDPEVIGRELRLGNTTHAVVGVMPEGFAFPMSHDLWIPLEADPARYGPGEGPPVFISGRLAPGVTLTEAQAELSVIERRMASLHPETHARFRAQVLPYHYPLLDVNQAGAKSFLGDFAIMQALIALVLVVVCVNVAILVYARTAMRRGEIAVRTALGASRKRIVFQLFAEALVLAGIAGVVGLGVASVGIRLGAGIMETETAMPFWMDLSLSAPALLYAAALVVLAALITGVLPALQATGKGVQVHLRRLGSGGGGGLGGTWTVLVVAQVAVAVTALPMAIVMGWWEVRDAATRPTLDVERYLVAFVAPDPEPPTGMDPDAYAAASTARMAGIRAELGRRLETQPGVAAVALSAELPVFGSRERVVFEPGTAAPPTGAGHEVRAPVVSPEALDAFDVRVLEGRSLQPVDLEPGAPDVVLVNRTFARRLLADGRALGVRLRFVAEEDAGPDVDADVGTGAPERWHEIVGVIDDLHANPIDADLVVPAVYRPRASSAEGVGTIILQLATPDAASAGARIRSVISSVDPTLRVRVTPLAAAYRQERLALALVALAVGLTLVAVLMLSAAGIYALLSFSVTQRRHEIGVRTALGAPPRRLLGRVFGRALRQVGLGVLVGVIAAAGLDAAADGALLRGYGLALVPIVVAIMAIVGLLAAFGPARRGLRIQPAEALRSD